MRIPSEQEVRALPFIVAVDFDGTLVTFTYRGIGQPIWKNVNLIKQYISHGAKVILWTCRTDDNEDKELTSAIEFCEQILGLHFDSVNDNLPEVTKLYGNTRKIHADIYFDDKGRCLNEGCCEYPRL